MSASEKPLNQPADFDLLQRTASGDGAAFEVFIERHQSAVFRHASCLLLNREDAEDVLQETFLSALEAAGQFRGDSSGRTWLLHIARNAALRRIGRTHASSEADTTLEALAMRAGWGVANPESLAMLAEETQRLDRALAALPKHEREILFLREWEDLSGEEAAALLGISLPAVKSRLHRARIHLAALLRDGADGRRDQ